MAIVEEPGGWRVMPAIDGAVRTGETVWHKSGQRFAKPIWVDQAGNRVVITDAPPELVTLVASLQSIAEPIPPEGHSALLAKLALLQDRLAIALPDSHIGGTQAADGRLVLRLNPLPSGGVAAEMVVVPVQGGQSFAPGGGSRRNDTLREGSSFAHQRQLTEERRRGLEIAEQLRLGGFDSPRPFAWNLPAADDAWNCSVCWPTALDDLVVQWPEGRGAEGDRTSFSPPRSACKSRSSKIGSA